MSATGGTRAALHTPGLDPRLDPLTDPLTDHGAGPASDVGHDPTLDAELRLAVLPTRLAAPAAGWEEEVDVLVVGSGVAGLTVARTLLGSGLQVAVATKSTLGQGSTAWAQGGVAAARDDADVPAHARDTLVAGAGLCDPDAVDTLVREGPAAIRTLIGWGARFDHGVDGALMYTREGGHSRARITHAGGDATGMEVQRALNLAVLEAPTGPRLLQRAFLLDLLTDLDGRVRGARFALLGADGGVASVGRVRARAVVLASGGVGQVFANTTNPAGSTADGLAAALRAGAAASDLEFVQFHPTVLVRPDGTGPRALITEAMRGEGAVLVDAAGRRVMAGAHPLADLAPRDVVSATIAAHLQAHGQQHVFLDATGLGETLLAERFPTILATCRRAGIDPVHDPIPVSPAAHYACGGIRADMSGRTDLDGLFAVGEVACTGVHGANRLASNSLLEGLVTGLRLGRLLLDRLPPRSRPVPDQPGTGSGRDPGRRAALAELTDRRAGVLRDPAGLADLAAALRLVPASGDADPATWEATNLHTVTTAVVAAARRRTESRGCHRRTDAAGPDRSWLRHIVTRLDPTTATLTQEIR